VTGGSGLEGRQIVKRYGGLLAVDRADVQVMPGEIAALIGPNGAGKTTLFHCLTGVERPDGGTVLFDGVDVTRETPDARARRGIGRTFQRLSVFPTMTVADNLSVAAENRTTAQPVRRVGGLLLGILGFRVFDETRHRRRVDEVVELLDLGDVRDAPAGTLPTGTLRLVELGRALCHDPKVLLLDEPASGLDGQETEHLQHVLRAVRGFSVAVLRVEHDVDLVFDVADRVYAMAEGRMIADGTPAEIRRHPAVREAYVVPSRRPDPTAPNQPAE
jgi:branched-chain amino acid transport system ATP-binding protein